MKWFLTKVLNWIDLAAAHEGRQVEVGGGGLGHAYLHISFPNGDMST